jgi:cell division inhibitor SepF
MSTMQRLKAYFGMIPADEVDGYDEYRGGGGVGRYHQEYGAEMDDFDDMEPPRGRRGFGARHGYGDEFGGDFEPAPQRRSWAPSAPQAPVRGALAVEPQPEPVSRIRAVPQHEESASSKITTLHLRSYNEARTIGEPYRDGTPVIMNLTEMEDADAKRLVDFAAGLAFALRGDIDKITNKVFLLSPPNVNVMAEVKGRIAEGGLFGRR